MGPTLRLRAMGIGDILDETIRLYRHNFWTFVGITATLLVPLTILQMAQAAIAGPSLGQQVPGQGEFYITSTIILTILSVFLSILIEAALVQAISDRYLGHVPTISGAYRVARRCLGRLLRTSIRAGLLVLLLSVTIVGIPFAIYFAVRWSLSIQTVVIEGSGARQALARSSGLVKGTWWRVLGVLIVASLMQLVAYIPAGIIGGILVAIGALFGGTAVLYIVNILTTAVSGVFSILGTPLTLIAVTLLYYDLRIRKEGFDLQVLAQRLER